MLIPGLLQLGEYADELGRRAPSLTRGKGWAARATAERLDRQALLSRSPVPLDYRPLIDEGALHRVVGGRELMARQLEHLLVVGERENVTIRVLPFSAGAYGSHFGALNLLEYPEPDEPLSVYVESYEGVRAVDDAQAEKTLVAVWEDAARHALDPEESARLIREVRDTRHG